ncbi:hypothetical protein ACFOHU_16475, partial [Ottowia pentelensis]|uniref:hypothetical protein n=1 Tax=Ottowia pentelensis TaxID=511108 RepID=UPI00361CE586
MFPNLHPAQGLSRISLGPGAARLSPGAQCFRGAEILPPVMAKPAIMADSRQAVKRKSCPTRYEPERVAEIPTRYEPEWAIWVDHF